MTVPLAHAPTIMPIVAIRVVVSTIKAETILIVTLMSARLAPIAMESIPVLEVQISWA